MQLKLTRKVVDGPDAEVLYWNDDVQIILDDNMNGLEGDVSVNGGLEMIAPPDSDNDEDRIFTDSSDSNSMPELASSDEWTSGDEAYWMESESDSGMSDRNVGNVTDLCRRRKLPTVSQGVITETGPFIPVSLGFENVESDDGEWEEVTDEWGNPTGVERKSFKLNVQDLRTESIDEDLDEVLRMNGLSDGINNRRVVGGCLNRGWLSDASINEQMGLSTDDQNEAEFDTDTCVLENIGSIDSSTDNGVEYAGGVGLDTCVLENVDSLDSSTFNGVEYASDMEMEVMLEILISFQVRVAIISLFLGILALVYSWLIAMNLIGRGECGIVPSGGPGTISQLGLDVSPSSLNVENFEVGDGENNDLGSLEDMVAGGVMIQDDGSTCQESVCAPAKNTEQ